MGRQRRQQLAQLGGGGVVVDDEAPLFAVDRAGLDRASQCRWQQRLDQPQAFVGVAHPFGQTRQQRRILGRLLQGTPGMSGATITGDGRIALILDVPSMLKRYARRI